MTHPHTLRSMRCRLHKTRKRTLSECGSGTNQPLGMVTREEGSREGLLISGPEPQTRQAQCNAASRLCSDPLAATRLDLSNHLL